MSNPTRRRFLASLAVFGAVPFLPAVPVKNLEWQVVYVSPIYAKLSLAQMRRAEREIAAMYGIALEDEA